MDYLTADSCNADMMLRYVNVYWRNYHECFCIRNWTGIFCTRQVVSIRRVVECLRRAKLRLRLAPTYFFKP